MDKVMVKVNSNFSRERIEHLKQVIKYLRPMVNNHKKDESLSQTSNVKKKSSYQEEKRKCQERGEYLGASVGVGAVVGATIGGTVAYVACASTSAVVSGVVSGAVVGGAIASYITKGSD